MGVQLKSKIRICKDIKLDKDYNNVLNYTEQQMLSLCESQDHLVALADDYSFIRNKGVISTKFKYDDALKCNYMAFQNKDYSNKWFFAFIDEVIYVGENNTEIRYTIDAWSTYFSTLTLKPSFVIREHTNDDTIGANTIPENLETGEYINQPSIESDKFTYLNNTYVCVAVTEVDVALPNGVRKYNNIYSGLIYLLFRNMQSLDVFVRDTVQEGKEDKINSMFMVPARIVDQEQITWITHQDPEYEYAFCPYSNIPTNINSQYVEKTNYLDENFVPVNKKLLCFPYKFFNITNYSGQTATYRYEDFKPSSPTNDNCYFDLDGCISPGCSIKLIPLNYKNAIKNIEEGIDGGKLPMCSWITDPYVNWLTQNGTNFGIQTAVGLGSLVLGGATALATGGATTPMLIGSMMAINGIGSISNAMQTERKEQLQPDQAHGGQNQGDFNFCGTRGFNVQRKTIKVEYARALDEYFTRFGYKTNRLKIPNITGRQYWNYIEINSNDDLGYGSVPNDFMTTINNIARRGVTIWHSHANIGNYNLNNSII